MEHLFNFLFGASNVFRIRPEPRGYRLDRHGFRTDAQSLRSDAAILGRDMRGVLDRDKQANHRARQG